MNNMIYFYLIFALYFGIIFLNGFFEFTIEIGAKVIWSDSPFLLPMDKVEDDVFKNNIGYTNRFERFTYRLKPVFRIRAKKRLICKK